MRPKLGLRAGQAGVPWRTVGRQLPHTDGLLQAALAVRAGAGNRLPATALAAIGVARPPVRDSDPVTELSYRLARLHRVAWQLTRESLVGIATLGDFAAAGVFVTEHAARLCDPGQHPGADTRRGTALRQTAASWRQVHLQTRQLRTLMPGIVGVHADVLAVRELLRDVERLTPDQQLHVPSPTPVLLGAARAFTDIARWNAHTLDQLAGRGQLYMPGRQLTRDEVSEQPHLVAAKLDNWLTPATASVTTPLRDAYDDLSGTSRNSVTRSRRPAAPISDPRTQVTGCLTRPI